MALWHLFLLSIIQGITEFLPVSSSAHLVLFPHLTGMADQGLIIDVAVHMGSLLAVATVFYKDVFLLIKTTCTYPKANKNDKKLLHNIIVASIPVIIAGAIFHIVFPDGLRDIKTIALMSIIFGIALFIADKFGKIEKKCDDVSIKIAFIIGIAHIFALIPGVSRSGVTMTASRGLGLSRVEAARFSLLIGMPVIAGAGAIGLYDLIGSGSISLGIDALFAVVFSFFSAWLSIILMLKWLQKFTFTPFVIYRIALGVTILLFFI